MNILLGLLALHLRTLYYIVPDVTNISKNAPIDKYEPPIPRDTADVKDLYDKLEKKRLLDVLQNSSVPDYVKLGLISKHGLLSKHVDYAPNLYAGGLLRDW